MSANTGARAALPDRVGGRDERERGHDHLVAGADARRRTARAAARSCSSWWPPRPARRRARAKAASNARTRGPWETQPEAITSATRLALAAAQIGTRERDLASRRARRERQRGVARAPQRHHSTSPRRPSSRPTSALRSRALARRVDVGEPARDLVDAPLAARTRPADRSPSPRAAVCASSSRLVSMPLAMLNTSRSPARSRPACWRGRCRAT